MNTPTQLTTDQAAERLGLTPGRVRQLAKSGRIGSKIGRDYLFTSDELDAFAAEDRPAGRPPRNERGE